ncbi:hypothetical protein [Lacimicrobium alkaliphilum]|uniref:Uncharacterized protein n=1 Tax=Lacimicrobium alkaliphilum TaxID=1526571 RepID=A0ABQ1RJS4_9ALTE|nr:hypothetical protein [Lacimicrobium alkaliphilum]GGD68794.1 hypothetical protein GCM10011357_24860 [Lacimicrobium alkaliphilum]
MFWEFIATITAGLGAAGIALGVRWLSRNRAPKWLIPVFAGLGMLGFQVQAEYTWYPHQVSLLPAGIEVVKQVKEQSWYRPWSYLWPQTLRFMAVDKQNAAANHQYPGVMLVDLYFFQRRATARRVTQVIDCRNRTRAGFHDALDIPLPGQTPDSDWVILSDNDPLLTTLCEPGKD